SDVHRVLHSFPTRRSSDLLSAALTAIYVLIVVGIGTTAGYAGGPLLNAAAALAIAVLFQPLRRRAQLLANRIVYGQRATPYQVRSEERRVGKGCRSREGPR